VDKDDTTSSPTEDHLLQRHEKPTVQHDAEFIGEHASKPPIDVADEE
jgi:hypothetical protein